MARKSDGRRIFTTEFKQNQVERMRSGSTSVAELSRKLGIARSLLQRWKRLAPTHLDAGGMVGTGIAAGQLEGPVRERLIETTPRKLNAGQYIRELQRLVGRQLIELELLRNEVTRLKVRHR